TPFRRWICVEPAPCVGPKEATPPSGAAENGRETMPPSSSAGGAPPSGESAEVVVVWARATAQIDERSTAAAAAVHLMPAIVSTNLASRSGGLRPVAALPASFRPGRSVQAGAGGA